MAGRLNPLFRPARPTDFTGRLSQPEMRGPAYGNADPGMVVQPYADPGAMPNANDPGGVVNQMPGAWDQGWRPTAGGADPYDFSDRYNTQLSPQQERAFQQWLQQSGRAGDLYDYDMRGFWQQTGGRFDPATGHGIDVYKKPNHPTFSSQSQYSGREGYVGGAWGQDGDAWTFQPGPTNMMSRDALKQYFRKVEPGNRLLFPREHE